MKHQANSSKRAKSKQPRFYRDGEVVEDVVLPSANGEPAERYRIVMLYCPEELLHEINCLSDFNYFERSEFVAVAARLLFDYLDERNKEELDALEAEEFDPDGDAEDILVSPERYPYEDEEDDGAVWAAEDEGDPAPRP